MFSLAVPTVQFATTFCLVHLSISVKCLLHHPAILLGPRQQSNQMCYLSSSWFHVEPQIFPWGSSALPIQGHQILFHRNVCGGIQTVFATAEKCASDTGLKGKGESTAPLRASRCLFDCTLMSVEDKEAVWDTQHQHLQGTEACINSICLQTLSSTTIS